MKIIALVGSIRRSSYNRKLATFVQKRYADQLDVTIPNLGALPFYDQDIELEAPAEVQAFTDGHGRGWRHFCDTGI